MIQSAQRSCPKEPSGSAHNLRVSLLSQHCVAVTTISDTYGKYGV